MRPALVVRSALAAVLLAAIAPAAAHAQRAEGVDRALRSVVAVRAGDDLVTGFRFGAEGLIATVAAKGPFRVTDPLGGGGSGEEAGTRDGITLLRVAELEGRGLRTAPAGRRRPSSGFVLGSPVGDARKSQRVALERRGSGLVIDAALPRGAQGAPVVDAQGRVLGMVGERKNRGRALIPAAALTAAAPRDASDEDGGRPLWQLVVAGFALLALLLAATTLVVRVRGGRRRRETAASAGSSAAADPTPAPAAALGEFAETHVQPAWHPDEPVTATQPLVQRREPAAESEPHEDFDIVFRSARGDDR